MSKDENGEKIPLNNQMYAEFNLKKPNLSGFNDNIKVDKTAKRSVSSKGKDMKGKDNFSGAKTNYDESNGFDTRGSHPSFPDVGRGRVSENCAFD